MGTGETHSNITSITLRSFRMKSIFVFTLMVLTLASTQAEEMTVEETQQRFFQFMYHLKDLSNEECVAMLQEFDGMIQPGGEISAEMQDSLLASLDGRDHELISNFMEEMTAENYEDICTFIREEL